ncbi:MAG: 23S rRNA (uracil(1939)-C(5))-methyltransferase RlmD [Clostridia bacterium]|nr:23S rRNA (uracil(1939)-C(5))-methyltransferase RlmD [Clostridia bacterium]
MIKNSIIHMECASIGANMEGVCRHEGQVVFVPGMLPGETGNVRIIKVQKHYCYGKLLELTNTSPCRQTTNCLHYPQCGGCSCRHIQYRDTLTYKQQQVQHCFSSIGHIPIELPDIIGMDSPFHYRNKSSFPVSGTSDQPLIGFYAERSHRIIPTDHCVNASDPSEKIIETIRRWITSYHIDPYQESDGSGFLRHIVIRTNTLGESLVTLVCTSDSLPAADDLIRKLKALSVTSLVININNSPTNVILGRSYRTVYGSGTIAMQLGSLKFHISSASFFQVNTIQTEKLYQKIIQYADLSENDIALDVYCGVGTISLTMSQYCQHVYGIEIVPQAIENARLNAIKNGIDSVIFYQGAAEDVLPSFVHQHKDISVIVVDPPRKGLDPIVIQSICSTAADRLIYVSCNPATLARDAALIIQQGYKLCHITCVDMFAWTSDVETIVLFKKI